MDKLVIWRYVLVHDDGLAPHIADGLCSLAVCKPAIRRYAKPGDWVMGFAPAAQSRGEPLVKYVMRIASTVPFETYCRQCAGKRRDAIYRYDTVELGAWFDNGYHDHDPAEGDLGPRDKGGRKVLLSTEFTHFGDQPVNLRLALPEKGARELWHRHIGQAKFCSREAWEAFQAWISGLCLDPRVPRHHPVFPAARSAPTRPKRCRTPRGR